MCVIIHQPKGKRQVTQEEFGKSWMSNPHWFWVMSHNGEAVVIDKSMEVNDAYRKYLAFHEAYNSISDIVLHFRMCTHWSITLDNVHPFYAWHWNYLVHNWILWYEDKSRPEVSDTRILAETLAKFSTNWVWNPVIREMVDKICNWDKILVMTSGWIVFKFGQVGTYSADWELWASNGCPFPIKHYNRVDYLAQIEQEVY